MSSYDARAMRRWSCVALLALSSACGDDTVGGGETEPSVDCEEHEVALPNGDCVRPGVLPDGCADGFVHDGAYGCDAVLPQEPCPAGSMALPGDISCHPVMECGVGTWGDIPRDATTQHVDATFVGVSDGGELAPWNSIGEAIVAAVPGAVIAVAAGSYTEDVLVQGKAVRIWGVCPTLVELNAAGVAPGALFVSTGADGSEVHGIAIRGNSVGLIVSGSVNVVVDRVWVHDTSSRGIDFEATFGDTGVTLFGSLVDSAGGVGVFAGGVVASIEDTLVRGTQPTPTQGLARGFSFEACDPATGCATLSRGNVTIARSVAEQNHGYGVFVAGTDATLNGLVIRDTLPGATLEAGVGLNVLAQCEGPGCTPQARAAITLSQSVITASQNAGVLVAGAEATISDTTIRDVAPRASDLTGGRGMIFQPWCPPGDFGSCDPAIAAVATVQRSMVERSHSIGLFGMAATINLEAVVVRDTRPRASDQRFGRALNIEGCKPPACVVVGASNVQVNNTLLDGSYEMGAFVSGSTAVIERTVVRNTMAAAGDATFGDGIVVLGLTTPTTAQLDNVLIDASTRAGIANFGSTVFLQQTQIQCYTFAINGETALGVPFSFERGDDVRCGCPMADADCKVVSAGLSPPSPLQ
jgi:hypothetical protein